MDHYKEDEKRDEGRPVIGKPGAIFSKTSAFGKTPVFSKAAGSVMARLKNLSKKDIAFVAVGMGVLIMAPVAEYMMSKPDGADKLMPGFGQRSEGGGSLYEPGINALSQGSPDGSGEVITPLSSRDPASLIIGSQPSQPPAAPQTSSPPKTDFRDSMKDSARTAFTEASKSAGVPTVIPRMQNSLRGMGSFFSGGEGTRTIGSLGGGKILNDARNASGKAASRSMVGPVASAGYKGVASSVPNSASRGAFEKLRSQADKAAGNFNGGSAISSLDRAAADSANLRMGGLGGGAEGEKTRSPSGSSIRDAKNNSGETLDQMAAKMRMQKALEWEFFKKYEIPKQIITSLLGSFNSVTAEFLKRTLTTALGMDPPPAKKCWEPYACKFGGPGYCNELYLKAKEAHVNPAKYICEDGGAYFITTSVGKESASTVKMECLCGRGVETPTYGAVTSKEAPSSVKPAVSNAADFADYDAILQDMVARTAETEAYPEKAEENAQSVAGGFQNLSAQTGNSVKNVLLNARNDAEKELAGYLGKINEAQAKLDGARARYEKFVSQIAALEKDLNMPGAAVRMKRDEAKGYEAVLGPEGKAKVAEVIKQWNDAGPVFFASAEGNLEGQRKWHLEYSSQLQLVGKGIESILDTQASIDKDVASINSEGGGIEKLKKMTDHSVFTGILKDVPLKTSASRLRAMDWTVLWEKEHKFDDSKAVKDETDAWNEWRKAVSAGKNKKEVMPDNFRSNKMRSMEIKEGVAGMLPNFEQIDWNISKTESVMPAAKTALAGCGVSDSYFK